MNGYDLIGDIHGDADKLKAILDKMGYVPFGRGYLPPQGRRAIFLGDLINRGQQNKQVVGIVRAMEEKGRACAIMGNHEFNAIGLARGFRRSTAEKLADHQSFLAEYPFDSDAYKNVIRWFETMPLFIRKKEFTVVHACWDGDAARAIGPGLRPRHYTAYKNARGIVYQAVQTLLKGPRIRLPKDVTCIGSTGDPRDKARVLWWASEDAPLSDKVEKGDQFAAQLPVRKQREIASLRDQFHYAARRPLFIGHYNLPATPHLVADNVACLNFRGYVTGYRWNAGDKKLSADQLVYV